MFEFWLNNLHTYSNVLFYTSYCVKLEKWCIVARCGTIVENDPWKSWKVMENFLGKTVGTLCIALSDCVCVSNLQLCHCCCRCVSCPAGHYVNPVNVTCTKCPPNTIVKSVNPWGKESCIKCGRGLRPFEGRRCVPKCHYVSDHRLYDWTSLARSVCSILCVDL